MSYPNFLNFSSSSSQGTEPGSLPPVSDDEQTAPVIVNEYAVKDSVW